METLAETLFNLLFNIINAFLSVVMIPINQVMQPVLAGLLTAEQLVNFYDVLNDYILPTCGFFVNIVPPLTWSAILIFITFYGSVFTLVFALHWVLKILRVAKRIVPFV